MIAAVLRTTWTASGGSPSSPPRCRGWTKLGLEVVVEAGAGDAAGFPDAAFVEKGARIVGSRAEALKAAEILLQVRPLRGADASFEGITPRHVTVGFLDPLASPRAAQAFAARGATAFALELLPRTTRAQAMDVLSSAATVVGYKAVLLAAGALPRMFPMMMTAGGTLTPARVFVIGGGVAGLQAIATARRLGAVVQAYDVRPAVKEQVESLGGKFVELPIEAGDAQDAGGYAKAMDEAFYARQREMMAKVIAGCDVVIATAAVPGKKAPVLITAEMVDGMPPGSVVVDVAAEQGGNCEVTRAGENVVRNGVTVMGPVNLAASVPYHASQMYARNVSALPGPDRQGRRAEGGYRRRHRPRDAGGPRRGSRPSEGPRGARPARAGGRGGVARMAMKKAKDVDAYIAAVPEPGRGMLKKMRQIVKAAAPKAVEMISYGIPLYKQHGHLTAFAAFKNHIGFYVMSKRLMAEYKKEFAPYKQAIATVQFPIGKPIPAALVRKVVKARIKENEARERRKRRRPDSSSSCSSFLPARPSMGNLKTPGSSSD